MFSNLLKHVIEKAKTGKDVTSSISIKIQSNINICFFCSTTYFRFPFSGKRNSAIRSQSVVARTQTSSNPFFFQSFRSSLANKLPGNPYFWQVPHPWDDRLLQNFRQDRIPDYLDTSSTFRYAVCGWAHYLQGKLRSIRISSKVIPSLPMF